MLVIFTLQTRTKSRFYLRMGSELIFLHWPPLPHPRLPTGLGVLLRHVSVTALLHDHALGPVFAPGTLTLSNIYLGLMYSSSIHSNSHHNCSDKICLTSQNTLALLIGKAPAFSSNSSKNIAEFYDYTKNNPKSSRSRPVTLYTSIMHK